MPNPIAAGAVYVGGKIVDHISDKNKEKKADKAAAAAEAKADAELAQQREDWEATYGGVEQNLTSYYNSLTPERYAAVGLENFQTEYQNKISQVKESLAQRGLQDTAVESSILAQGELNAAEERAGIRSDAEDKVIEQKQNWLQFGMQTNPDATALDYQIGKLNMAEAKHQQAIQNSNQSASELGDAVSFGYTEFLQSSVTDKSNTGLGDGS